MPLGPLTTIDTFSISNPSGGGWYRTDNAEDSVTRQDWQNDASAYSFLISESAADAAGVGSFNVYQNFPDYYSAYVDLDAKGIAPPYSSEVLCLVRTGTTISQAETDHGPILARKDANNFYMARLRGDVERVSIVIFLNGTMRELNSASMTLNANTWYWVRFQKKDRVRLKVWRLTATEPSSWTTTADVYMGSAIPDGQIGIPENSQPATRGPWGYGARRTGDNHTVYIDAFYGYTFSDVVPSSRVVDNFDRKTLGGFGLTSSGHVWEGVVANTPTLPNNGRQGFVSTVTGAGRINTGSTEERVAWVNLQRTGDVIAEVELMTNAGSANAKFWLGLHGSVEETTTFGTRARGYILQYSANSTTLSLWYRQNVTDGWTSYAVNTNAPYTNPGSNTLFKLKFAKLGNILRGKVWASSVAEPSSWNIEILDSTVGGTVPAMTGVPFFVVTQSDATARWWDVYSYSYDTYIASGTTHTVIGALTTPTVGSNFVSLSSAYTNDTNNSNSIVVQYKQYEAETWNTWTGTAPVRGTNVWTVTVSGLLAGRLYDFRVTYTDADGIIGDNPQTKLGVSTTTTGIQIDSMDVSSATSSTVGVNMYYTNDTNDSATVSLRYRTTTQINTMVSDLFEGGAGTLLTQHEPNVGGPNSWIKHTASTVTSPTSSAQIWRDQLFMQSFGAAAGYKHIYYNDAYSGTDYEVAATVFIAEKQGNVGVVGRQSAAVDSCYYAMFNPTTDTVHLYRIVSGTMTQLASASLSRMIDGILYPYNVGDSFEIKLVMRNPEKYVYINNVLALQASDNTVSAAGYGGIRFEPTFSTEGKPTNQVVLDSFEVRYRTPAGSWTTSGSMTRTVLTTSPTRTGKFFRSVTGLSSDTIYEFNPVVSDSDGVFGDTTLSIIQQTKGSQVSLTDVVIAPTTTTAQIDVFYIDDSNNNSSITMQYKAITDHHWSTVPPTQIFRNTGAKKFSTNIHALRSGITYEVVVRITDPDGLVEGTPSEISRTFATQSHITSVEKRAKHYLWKVYDRDDKYITTWEDAGEPEFSYYENGGVSDLRTRLPWRISDIDDPKKGLDFQNRVDVWCLDPSSDGFGINMVLNPNFETHDDPEVAGNEDLPSSWTVLDVDADHVDYGNDYGPGEGTGVKISTVVDEQITVRSEYIPLYKEYEYLRGKHGRSTRVPYPIPLVAMCSARARGTKLILDIEAYDSRRNLIGGSPDYAETIGSDWQVLRVEYTPPQEADSVRVTLRNASAGAVYAGNVSIRAKENLVYRGHVETFSPTVDDRGESVEVEILGVVSFLSDDYVDFLQYLPEGEQPQEDVEAGRLRKDPTDPANMLRDLVDLARAQNPRCSLYYTPESIRNTNTFMTYTFRNKQLRGCFDKVRELCPAGWHYFIETDGLVVLRGPEHAPTHKLRIGVEVTSFRADRSIRNLKNVVVLKGRQDEDRSEPDGYGSIKAVATDAVSIETYGRRVMHINDASVTNPETADIIAEGRLEEHNREEQKIECVVIDVKYLEEGHDSLRGYNIESFRPGDNVEFFDPISGPAKTFWNHFNWDDKNWDINSDFSPISESVPIKRIQFQGHQATLELSERQPSSVGDFGRMYRILQQRSEESGE